MYRLFVAVDVSEQARDAISRICSGMVGVRWVDGSQLHLTLRFIGDADGSLFGRIRQELAGVAGPSFPLYLRGVGSFPPRRDPRVLWVGVERSGDLLLLHHRVEEALARCGLEPEKREFAPHITLARLKGASFSGVASFLDKNRLFSVPPFQISEFHLYSSTLAPQGAIHRREVSYPLKG